MDVEEPDLAPEAFEAQVARAMETARRRSGLTVTDMARRLRRPLRLPEVPPEKKDIRNTWYAWRQNPRSIPAVALLAAAALAGDSVDDLLQEVLQPSAEGRLAKLEREVAEQQQMIARLLRERGVDAAGGATGPGR